MNEYVIIGNGVAAAGCIEGIRSRDPEGGITVISEEKHAVYCRPLISYYLQGKTDQERMRYRAEDFYERMCCRVLFGQKAVRILPAEKTVCLEDGEKIPYTHLCIAAGSAPFVPPFEGLESVREKYSFMTLDDALALEQAAEPDSRVLIVGAGLIGLKCAEGLTGRVGSVTVCDLADRVLSSILDSECAGLMQKHLEEQGVRFFLSDSVARFEGKTAHMQSGQDVDFDLLVLAVGVRANISLLREAGGETDRGILIDERMRTSLDGIYAAG
ncbi:MAG: FAD-dependent oxidoreductase, partial [Lachnospiraceae bacterium]|nr:FAD-dependent oxidoreductase [Lachnospiraceae bacterium]